MHQIKCSDYFHAMLHICCVHWLSVSVPAEITVAFVHTDIDIFTHAAILFGPVTQTCVNCCWIHFHCRTNMNYQQ